MIESAILLIHVDGTAVDIMCLYVATRSRGVEKIAEPSRLTMRIVSVMNQWCDGSNSSYPMTQASLAALDALTRKCSPLPAINPSTQARDGQLTHVAEEGRLIRFGARWGIYTAVKTHARPPSDKKNNRTDTRGKRRESGERVSEVTAQHSKLGWWILAGLWATAPDSLESWPAAANHAARLHSSGGRAQSYQRSACPQRWVGALDQKDSAAGYWLLRCGRSHSLPLQLPRLLGDSVYTARQVAFIHARR
jgi:hypothetical protein